MKHVLLMVVLFISFSILSVKAQVVYTENFETAPISLTSSSTGTGSWGLNSRLYSQGTQCDSVFVTQGDTTYLTMNSSFSTTGMSAVYLNFDHICKIAIFDSAFIDVSNDNGATWQQIKGGHYLGSGQFNNIGYRFSVASYAVDWSASVPAALPQQTWWKHESFDISTLVGNAANVKIRFRLIDGDNNGATGYNGWYIDSVVVTASVSELIPPNVTLLSPITQDTVYNSDPINIAAAISDNSGIDTALCIVQLLPDNVFDTIPMVFDATTIDTFRCTIPFYGFGRTSKYYVIAWDQSVAHNSDSTATYQYIAKNSPGGTAEIGTGTSNTSYPFDTYWHDSRSQMIYTAAEINAAGAFGGPISSIEFNVSSFVTDPMSGFAIKMKSTSSNLLSGFIDAGFTTVYTASSYSLSSAGWTSFTLSTPFVWDGTSNIIIETCFDNTAYTSASNVFASTVPSGTVWSRSSDGQTGCTMTGGSARTLRPNIRINIVGSSDLTNDIGVAHIINPNSGILVGTNYDVIVDLKNFGVDTITSAQINWSIDGVIKAPYTFGTPTDTIFPDSIKAPITLGTETASAGTHHVIAWTTLPNGSFDNDIMNDTAKYSFYGCASILAGNYTIGGTSPDFPSFSDAVLALNQCGISAPVTFNVRPGTYNEQLSLNDISGTSAANTIVFQAENGDSSSVILAYDAIGVNDNYVVKLNATNNVGFNSMTIQAEDSTNARVFVLSGYVNGFTLTNSVVQTTVIPTSNDDNLALVISLDTVGDNMIITNNVLTNSINAISLEAGTVKASNWVINDNIIKGHYATAIHLTNSFSAQVNGNTIMPDTGAYTPTYNGIVLIGGAGSAVITKNMISSTNTKIVYGILFQISAFDTLNHTLVANNVIDLHTLSTTNTLSAGVLVNEASCIDIYNNSINLKGNQSNSANIILYDVAATAGTSFGINITNNSITNMANGYLYYINNVDTNLWANNNNNIYIIGGGSNFAYLDGSVGAFSDWVTESGAMNSLNIDPYLSATTGIKIHNNLLNNMGTPLTSITDDIDGVARDAQTPDIGAYEFDAEPWDILAMEVLTPMGSCGMSSAETVTVRYRNIGTSDISGGFNASYQLVGSSTVVTEAVTATILAGDTLDYQFAATVDFDIFYFGTDSTFIIKAWGDLTNDLVAQNDSTIKAVNSGFIPSVPITSDTSVTYGGSIILTAISTDSLIWFATNDTSTEELAITNHYNTGNLYDTTTYWVGSGGGAPAIKLTETVQYKTATGATNPYPSYFPTADFDGVEISNLGSSVADLSGYTINIVSSAASVYTFPAGTQILPGEVLMALFYSGVVPGPMPNNVFYVPYISSSSSTLVSYWLTDPSGAVVDAFASNGATFPAGSGVTAADFSGSLMGGSGHPGAVRELSDNNLATDWAVVLPGVPSFGSFNSQLSATGGSSCISLLAPLQVDVLGIPSTDASVNAVISPMGNVAANTAHDLEVEVKNYGTTTITTLDISYTTNNGDTTTFSWTGSIPYQQYDTITIGSLDLDPGMIDLTVWSSNPNGLTDTINSNDTAMVSFTSCMNGTYTIGDTAGGAAFDYPSFTSAVNVLNDVGVCAPVVFVVDTGVYNEQFIIDEFDGSSATNTVTFTSVNGDSSEVLLHHLLTYANNYIVEFNGADYVTFKNMTLQADMPSYYGRIFVLQGNADHISITNNVIDAGVGSSNTSAGIYSLNTKDDFTTIVDNHFINGYSSIYLWGPSGSNEVGHIIENNVFEDFIGGAIYVSQADSIIIMNNDLKSTAIGNTTWSQYYGINITSCNNNVVVKSNTILLKADGKTTGINVNVLQSNISNKSIIANNTVKIYNGELTNIGMKINNCTHVDLTYNSLNVRSGDAGSAAIYLNIITLNGNISVTNNLFIDSNSYAAIIMPAGVGTMNYNSFYSNSDGLLKYDNIDYTSLSDYQTASSKDANSVNLNPDFANFDDMHYANSLMAGLGTPVVGITVDMDGDMRDAVRPTIGADEKEMAKYDIGVVKIINLTDTMNEGNLATPIAIIYNYGYDTISSGFDINYSLNNGTAVVYNYTDTLFPAEADTVTLADFNATASNSQICVTTVLAADTSTYNDTQCHYYYGFPTRDALLIDIVSIEETCNMTYDTVKVLVTNIGLDTINGSGQTNNTISYQSNASTTVNEPFTSVVAPFDSVWYEFTTLTYVGTNNLVDSLYSIRAWINFENDSYVGNDSITTLINSPHTPDAPIYTSPLSVVYATPAVLNATSPSNDSVVWFFDATISDFEAIGTQYTTNWYVTQDTSMWLSAQIVAPSNSDQLGTSDDVNLASGYPTPFANWYWGNKEQYLITATELADLGITAGPVTQLEFEVAAVNSVPALSNYKISIGHSIITEMTAWEIGLTPVYNATSYTPHDGWNTFNFSTPFVYDGVSNVVIEICSNNSAYISNGNASVKHSTTSFVSTLNIHQDNTSTICSNMGIGIQYSLRPNIRLKGTSGGCASPRVEFEINPQAQSACDVSAYNAVDLFSQVYMTNNEVLKLEIKNFGTADQASIPVSYTINGGTAVTENASVLANGSLVHTFVTPANFSAQGVYDVKFYTALSCDNVVLNDTFATTVENLIPDYCNSTATSTYNTFVESVQVGLDSNVSTSTSSKYTDYTTMGAFTTVAPSNSYNLSIDVGAGGTAMNGYVKVYIDYNRDGIFDPIDDLVFGDSYTGASSSAVATVTGTIVVPATAIIGTTHMRVVCKENGTAADVDPCGGYTYGETEDYQVNIAPYIQQDAGVEQILGMSSLVTSNIIPLDVRVRNYGSDPILSVDIVYEVNGAATTFTYSTTIAVGDSADISLGNITINDGANTVCAHTVLASDDNYFNDESCNSVFREAVSQLAFQDDFEGSDLWRRGDYTNQWTRGVPMMTNINTAHSPVNVWAIGIDTTYNDDSYDMLYSPKFEITSNLDSAYLKFWQYYNSELDNDGGYIQYRKNSANWASLGYLGDARATAWYTSNVGGTYMWTGNSNGWTESTYFLDFTTGEFEFTGTSDTIQFRYVFFSDAGVHNFDGWAIDDFSLELPQVPNDVGVTAITSPAASVQAGEVITIIVDVKNLGTSSQASIPVWYTIDGATAITETFTPATPLLAGATGSYTFTATGVAPSTNFQLCSGTSLSGDSYPQNDDICTSVMVTPANIDASITAISVSPLPGNGGDTTCVVYPITVTIELTNAGVTALTSIPVRYTMDHVNYVDETWSGNMAPGEVDTFVFVTTYNSPLGNYNLCGITDLANDPNASNNEMCRALTGATCIGLNTVTENAFEVSQNEPNPAQGKVRIAYIVPANGNVVFELRNALGQIIYNLDQDSYTGDNTIEVDASDLANGVYYYSVTFDGQRITRKMVVNQ